MVAIFNLATVSIRFKYDRQHSTSFKPFSNKSVELESNYTWVLWYCDS